MHTLQYMCLYSYRIVIFFFTIVYKKYLPLTKKFNVDYTLKKNRGQWPFYKTAKYYQKAEKNK